MLTITGGGTQTKVEHREPALPQNELVPSKREAIEALGNVQTMMNDGIKSLLKQNEIVTLENSFDVLRRFVLTR